MDKHSVAQKKEPAAMIYRYKKRTGTQKYAAKAFTS